MLPGTNSLLCFAFVKVIALHAEQVHVACPAGALSTLQISTKIAKNHVEISEAHVSEQQFEREKRRQAGIVQDLVQVYSGFVNLGLLEGMSEADAHANLKAVIANAQEPDIDLASDASRHDTFLKETQVVQDLMCHVSTGDCMEESRALNTNGLSSLTSNLLQLVSGKRSTTKNKMHGANEGKADAAIVTLSSEAMMLGVRYAVSVGEDPDVEKQAHKDALAKLQEMVESGESLASEGDLVEVSQQIYQAAFRLHCSWTTGSCSQSLHQLVGEITDLLPMGSSLLQVGVAVGVKIMMKLLGVPEFPEETATERAAASKAVLAQRRLQGK